MRGYVRGCMRGHVRGNVRGSARLTRVAVCALFAQHVRWFGPQAASAWEARVQASGICVRSDRIMCGVMCRLRA